MSRRTQQIIIAVIALALIVSVGAVGLSGIFAPRNDQATDPTDTRAAVDPASQPAASPTTAPTAPAEMTQQSADGAQATLRYLLESYAYMMATGDTAAWSGAVDPNCQVCVQFIANATALHDQGGYGVGGEFTVTGTTFEGTGEPPASGTATADFTEARQLIIDDPAKEPLAQGEIAGRIQAVMVWDGEQWRVGDLSIGDPGSGASDAGGSDAGGSDAGGSDAGGSDAGGAR